MQDYETELLQKKKKKKEKVILFIVGDEEQSHKTYLSDLQHRIIQRMSQHIGRDNAVNNQNLFEFVYRTLFHRFNIYQKFYYWNIIKKIIHSLRATGKMFIIIQKNYSYVLKTEEELQKLKNGIKNNIIGLKKLEKTAEDWVNNKKYLHLNGVTSSNSN